jgi:hypothetical protein
MFPNFILIYSKLLRTKMCEPPATLHLCFSYNTALGCEAITYIVTPTVVGLV